MAEPGKIKHHIVTIVRVILGAIFIYAGAIKAWDPTHFMADMHGYKMLPHDFEVASALYLPWLELLTGICLVSKRLYAGAAFIQTLLMLIFTVAIVSAKVRGLNISCGCFGESGPPNFPWYITRDLLLLCGLGFLLWDSLKTVAVPIPEVKD